MIASAIGRPSAPVRCADGDPDGQGMLHRPRHHELVGEWRAQATRPAHRSLLTDAQQQLELLGEQLVVVVEIEAEEGKGFDEGAASRHDFRTSVR